MAPFVAIIGASGVITVRGILLDCRVQRSRFCTSALRWAKSSLLIVCHAFLTRRDPVSLPSSSQS